MPDSDKPDLTSGHSRDVEFAVFEVSRYCRTTGCTTSIGETSGGSRIEQDACVLMDNWKPFKEANAGSDLTEDSSATIVSSTSTSTTFGMDVQRLLEAGDVGEIEKILKNQREKYRNRLLVEKAKRKAVEKLLINHNETNGPSSASSRSGLSSSCSRRSLMDDYMATILRKQMKKLSLDSSSDRRVHGADSESYCSCSNKKFPSASSVLPDSESNLRAIYACHSAPCSNPSTSDRLWFLPLRPCSAPPLPLQDCLKLKRPHVVESIEQRRRRLRQTSNYRKAVSSKIRQLAEHATLGLISEREADAAIKQLPRPDLYLNNDILRETKRNHRHLPERLEKLAQYRKQLQLATNRTLSRMVAQRISYERRCRLAAGRPQQ